MVRLSLAFCALTLTTALVDTNVVWGQPDPVVTRKYAPDIQPPKPSPVINVSITVPPQGEVQLSIQAFNAKVSDIVSQIAVRGNLEIIVRPDAEKTINSLTGVSGTAVGALKNVCKVANLECEEREGVWIVSPLKTPIAEDKDAENNLIQGMEFKDIDVKEALLLISEQFNVKISFATNTDASKKIPYLRLNRKMPREAIALVASAAGLTTREDQGLLIISKDTPAE